MINKKRKSFGWFDVVDDIEVQSAFEKVYELGRKNNLEHVEGPMDFLTRHSRSAY
jgi:hypothetical protein